MVGTLLVFTWLWVQWTHEAGHVVTGLLTGADLDRVVLDPRTISRTDFVTNPRPEIVVWGGPLIGCLLGAGLPLLASLKLAGHRQAFWIIAAVVLIGNGAYIGLGAFMPVGDAEVMLNLGHPRWLLVLFGVVCVLPARRLIYRAISQMQTDGTCGGRSVIVCAVAAALMAGAGLIGFPK